MKIEGIKTPSELPELPDLKRKPADGVSFGDTLNSAINEVVEVKKEAEAAVKGMATGDGTDLHTAMLAMQKADVSFQMMMQVRNKLISAYEEVMRMQV